MANTIGFGQAAVNNTIDYGQGAIDNTINWGKSQTLSPSGETNITGTGATPPFSNTKSILLDGVDDFVDCGNPTSLQITGKLTLSAWFKTSSTDTQMIIGKDNVTTNRSYLLYYSSGNGLRFLIFKGGGGYELVDAVSTVTDGQWHHVMGVNDGTDLKIYVDGVLEGTNAGGGGSINNGSSNFYIGKREGTQGQYLSFFNGGVDSVAVWNTDQSANASAIGSTIPTDLSIYSPLSWWRCGDGDTAPTLTDNGSGGNDGTMTNFTTFSTDVPT